jgi:hypothetical protein
MLSRRRLHGGGRRAALELDAQLLDHSVTTRTGVGRDRWHHEGARHHREFQQSVHKR